MKLPADTLWTRLARARAGALLAQQETDDAAPLGFATRVVAQWQAMNRDERFLFWRSWSLRAVVGAVVVCLAVLATQRLQPAMAGPLQAPSIPLPLP